MTEEMHHNDKMKTKVINIFQRHRRGDTFHFEVEGGGEVVITPDGFNYVSFKSDSSHDAAFVENCKDIARRKNYLIRMLEHHKDADRINNYYVPGERLEEFLLSLKNRPGQILEIERLITDQMA